MENHETPEELKKKVLDLIQKGHFEPQTLVKMMREEGVSEETTRTVMSDLIDRNAIIFTKDWHVELNPLASAAA
ncbi:MAG TPA: hypothetical protein VEX43_12595 [Chthoniobacterales bacterium]|nr:hypothetical protein [Chthoniobacterales bacterium]